MHHVFLSMGSNLGRRKANLQKGIHLLASEAGKIQCMSSLYETEPWGCTQQKSFFNCVVELVTGFNPKELLIKIQDVERLCGRVRTAERYAARALGIDILLYDNRIISTDQLTVPHLLMHLR